MNSKKDLTTTFRRLADLRKEVATLPTEQALDRILAAKEPAALVHSFPPQDLHLLVHDIGLANALPVLRLASKRQWEYFLDVEGWHRDRMDLDAITLWAHLLLSADPVRMTRWVNSEKVEFFEYYLFKNIRVVLREHDQDPSDFGEGYFTLDGTFYIHILDHPEEIPTKDEPSKQTFGQTRRQLITDLLKRLADEDPVRFHQILIEAMHVIPAEVEEAAFRRRNVRMAENGFLPFDEAVGIYQPLKMEDIKNRPASPQEFRSSVDARQSVMRFAGRLADRQNLVIQALENFDSETERLSAEMELAGLTNRLIVADQKQVRDRADLKQAVRKACGYIRIGLCGLTAVDGDPSPDLKRSAAMMAKYSLPSLFQLGFGYALHLKWRVDQWYRQSWVRGQGLALTFLGEAWMGVLGGLLLKKPLYFDESLQDQRYREFASMDDIVHTEAILDRIIAMDTFLNRIGIDLDRQYPAEVFLTYKNLLLTLWGRRCLDLSNEVSPIELSLFRSFYTDQLFESPQTKQADEANKIRKSAKQLFLDWLISRSGFSETKIMAQIGPTLDELFSEIEKELGRVEHENIDPRFVSLFLLK